MNAIIFINIFFITRGNKNKKQKTTRMTNEMILIVIVKDTEVNIQKKSF